MLFEGEHMSVERVRGLAMMIHARERALGAEDAWISQLAEEAFATTTEDERRTAIALAGSQP